MRLFVSNDQVIRHFANEVFH